MSNYQTPYYISPNIQPQMQNMYGYNYQPQAQMQTNIQPQVQKMQGIDPMFKASLQGKSVDSIDVVKAMDIPLDGSISYFPLTDGTAIVTKQLQVDGTSKTLIYKQVEEKEIKDEKKYVTIEEVNELLNKNSGNDSYKDDIKYIKRQVKDIIEDIKEINEYIDKRKD